MRMPIGSWHLRQVEQFASVVLTLNLRVHSRNSYSTAETSLSALTSKSKAVSAILRTAHLSIITRTNDFTINTRAFWTRIEAPGSQSLACSSLIRRRVTTPVE